MKTQDTNFNPKMSSEPIEEKPFLTEDDCGKLWESANAFFGSTGGVNPGAFNPVVFYFEHVTSDEIDSWLRKRKRNLN